MKKTAIFASLLLLIAASSFAASNIVIVNLNAPNLGFNDPTPVAPVGGNTGTTLGQQRLNAFQYAADIWGATLDSKVEIRIQAQFASQTPQPMHFSLSTMSIAYPNPVPDYRRNSPGVPPAATAAP